MIDKYNLCTAYKSTVQSEQAGVLPLEPGRLCDSGYFYIRGTVAVYTDSWVFFFYFLKVYYSHIS